ncbi:hypothetical protein AAHE18_19G066300 [Arachis hypogaea]
MVHVRFLPIKNHNHLLYTLSHINHKFFISLEPHKKKPQSSNTKMTKKFLTWRMNVTITHFSFYNVTRSSRKSPILDGNFEFCKYLWINKETWGELRGISKLK